MANIKIVYQMQNREKDVAVFSKQTFDRRKFEKSLQGLINNFHSNNIKRTIKRAIKLVEITNNDNESL